MKRLLICTLCVMLAGPFVSHAQTNDQDQQNQQNQSEYRDVNDGQVLKLVSYILTPVGMALEWGVMRPLHYLATQTSAKPLLSGDQGPSFFVENNNASQVPPGTFRPNTINPTNNLQASNNSSTSAPAPSAGVTTPPTGQISASQATPSGGQPALH
jgi:hypothetical protein